MNLDKTALVMIGYQNDYFDEAGILRAVVEEADRTMGILANTLRMVEQLKASPILMIQTPIVFTNDYSELVEPVGILQTIAQVGAFQAGTKGAQVVGEFEKYKDRITTIAGKRGLNAFSNTVLDEHLRRNDVKHVVLCGAVTSICIDSTGRSAHERGYKVSVLSDCTASRTRFEQDFYCENVFPLYANVLSTNEFLGQVQVAS
jgi:nicotinamidase-related amidase